MDDISFVLNACSKYYILPLQRETWKEEQHDEYMWPEEEEEEHMDSGLSPISSLANRESRSTCMLQLYDDVYYYSSPDFGVSDYPNNTVCTQGFAVSVLPRKHVVNVKKIKIKIKTLAYIDGYNYE